jgi:hypothetical protein
MVAVLHLSDIHRSPDDPVANEELVAALESDRGRWPPEFATGPDLVVISGDLIQGVGLGTDDYEHQLQRQYAEAARFLVDLTARFLDGDRSRIVIVPGNHDVDWNSAREAMEVASSPEVQKLATELPALSLRPTSAYRWSWAERQFLRIANLGAYGARQTRFLEFRREFYSGVQPDPLSAGSDLFYVEYPQLDVSVTGLSSWFGNDCFCHVGAFDPEMLLRARDLIAASTCRLHIAVWHHSTSGPPERNDYLDLSSVRKLVDYGYRLGLHGHQHRAETSVATLRLPTTEEMALVSAGSLCAGHRDLPPGVNRQYNILSVSPPTRKARLHIREAIGESLIYASSLRTEFGGQDSIDLTWTSNPGPAVPISQQTAELDEAYRAYGERDFSQAAEILSRLPTDNGRVKQLKIEVLRKLGRNGELADLVNEPENADELIVLVDALCQVGQYEDARQALARHAGALGLQDDLLAHIEAKILVAEMRHA